MSTRTLTLICAISILLNIFLLGATVGGASWLHAQRQGGGSGSIRAAGAALRGDQRQAFRQALREARQEMRPTLAAEWRARRDAAALLREPSLDQAAFDTALGEIRADDMAVRAHVETRLATVIATLPADARAALAEGLVRRPRAAPHR
jgi:uncharacterized membrane protein